MFHGFLLPRGPRSSPKPWARGKARGIPAVEDLGRRVTVRLAEPRDENELRLLAALDSARVPNGAMLVGEMGGSLQAAVPIAGGRALANPFVRTAELVALLELRARQLRDQGFGETQRVISLSRGRRPSLAGRAA